MVKTLRFISGYVIGIAIFLILVPYGFFALSKLDYLVDYKMLINSMVLRMVVSGILLLIGAIFMMWSNIFLFLVGKGGPADAMGVSISPRTEKLVTRGPYRFCRHPMVFGALCVYLSLVIFMNSVIGLLALLILICLAAIYLRNSEEKRLLKDFGDEYLEYKKKVPMLFPLIKFRKSRV